MSWSQMSDGYFTLVKKGASDNQICDFLDKQLGVQHKLKPVIVMGATSTCGDVVFDTVSGKILGFIGNHGPVRNSNCYCPVLTCANWQCELH